MKVTSHAGLVRARAAAVETLRVHWQHVSAFMLKHGRIYPRKKGWTMRYLRWLQEQPFDHPAHQIALQEMVEAVRVSKERVDRLEGVIEEFVPAWSLAPIVRALRLTARYRMLSERGKRTTVVCTAIARELAGFMWAVAREAQAIRS